VINGAAALFGVEEPADPPEVFVGLAAQAEFAAVCLLCEALLGRIEIDIKMLSEPLDVTAVDGNDRIGAAEPWAFRAIVRGHAIDPSRFVDRISDAIGARTS
jgi:hypothetical protein